MVSVKQGSIKYYFLILDMTLPEIETRSPEPVTTTLPTIQKGLHLEIDFVSHTARSGFWFGLVLWHTNYGRLFDSKSYLYIDIHDL